jgi:hypothetical protein
VDITELHFAIPANRAVEMMDWVDENCPSAYLDIARHMSIADMKTNGSGYTASMVRLGRVSFTNDAEALFFKCAWSDFVRPVRVVEFA